MFVQMLEKTATICIEEFAFQYLDLNAPTKSLYVRLLYNLTLIDAILINYLKMKYKILSTQH